MKTKQNIVSYIICIVIALVFIGISFGFEYVAAKTIPLIVASLVILLAVIGVIGELIKKNEAGGEEPQKPEEKKEEKNGEEETWRKYAQTGLWLLGLFAVIVIFGFLIAVPLFLLSYMIFHKTKWYISLSITVVTSAILYSVFVVLLNMNMYPGLLFL